ncbi:MAG: hypothetical protein IR153_10130 [Flavobacterium sp.]|nr:hypothetical protein [Flavobacterium sp.]
MGKTTLTLDKEHFTEEVTASFLIDFENCCKSMELSDFVALFKKYDLSFLEDYNEVFDLIAHITTSWKKPGEETKLLDITEESARCIFCNIGKAVRVFKWTYIHTLAEIPMNRVVYESKAGFYFEYQDKQLIEFGVCNAYT